MISSFIGEHRFLSNFFIEPDGSHVEGEYQASKCADPIDRERFIWLSPGQCKRAGQRVKLREDWLRVRLDVMYALVKKKFNDHPELAKLLLATGDEKLIEGNRWGDRYWGVYNGAGANHLGKILMRVRRELRDGVTF